MRTCPSCGLENTDDAHFCSCGEYLRWDPTRNLPAVKPTAATAVAGPPDPNATLAPETVPRDWATPAAPGGLPVGVAPVPGRPGTGDAPPAAASLTLRSPDDEGSSPSTTPVFVQPGQNVTIVGVIRNQSEVVDNFDLSIRGLPQEWWTITPATAYLVPYGSDGAYEQEFQIHISPPRKPEAKARTWPFEVVAESRAYGGEVLATGAAVTIGAYYEVATELRPLRASGRLKARYRLVVRNRANARTEVRLNAEDTEGKCQFRFAEPKVVLEPGNALECPFTVFPPKQHWIGRPIDRRFTVTAAPVEVETPPPPRAATFRQRAWLSRWLLILLLIALVLAFLLIRFLPHSKPVPNVVGLRSVFAAQQVLNRDGFNLAPKTVSVTDKGGHPVGSVAQQSPSAGTKAKAGAMVTLEVYTGTGEVKVPSVVGLTVGKADESLRGATLALGAVTPQPVDPSRKVVSQLPLAGASVPHGTAIAVFLSIPTTARTTTSTTRAATTTAAARGVAVAPAHVATSLIKVPSVTGDATTAAGKISQAKLEPKPIESVATAPPGQVVGTIPKAGSSVDKGAVVALLISIGSPQLSYDDQHTITVVDPIRRTVSGVVPPGSGPQVEASWSPDGTHVIYSQNGQLVIAQPDNSAAVPLELTTVPRGESDVNPAFAPTLRSLTIAFVENLDGSSMLCFATIGKPPITPSCTSAPPGWSIGGDLDWVNGSSILVPGTRSNGANFGLLEFASKVPFSTHASNWGHGTLVTNASVAGQGVFDAQISPNGTKLALVAGSAHTGFGLYIVPSSELRSGQLTFTYQQALGVSACQVAWRPDDLELAVMQSKGPCQPNAIGTIVGVDPEQPAHRTVLATDSADPAWQPVPGG